MEKRKKKVNLPRVKTKLKKISLPTFCTKSHMSLTITCVFHINGKK